MTYNRVIYCTEINVTGYYVGLQREVIVLLARQGLYVNLYDIIGITRVGRPGCMA